MNHKKRILFTNEFSQLATGFSSFGYYLLPRLYATGKYHLGELACYVDKYHPAINNVPWDVFPNEPDKNNPEEVKKYQSNKLNQFGAWRFEEVSLKFRQDIQIDCRDPWQCDFINKSPYRKNFKYIHMPTVDGYPQKFEWIDDYSKADKLLTYSYFGKSLVEGQSAGKVKVDGVMSYGVDTKVFKPLENKTELRKKLGIREDAFIITVVMRNQPRKLFPELMRMFHIFLKICSEKGNKELAAKTFFHFHTSHPDVGWDLPQEMRTHHLSHKILYTYVCDKCGAVYLNNYNRESHNCKKCTQPNARFPNTANGIDRQALATVIGLGDCAIQYSICEGQSLPINEAKACGLPVFMVDYSAMTEQAYNGGGIPIKVQKMMQESVNATNQLRALPDNQDCAEKLYAFLSGSEDSRKRLSEEAITCARTIYDWDVVAKGWEELIDSIECPPQEETWLSRPKLITSIPAVPQNLTNEQFVHWCYHFVLQRPDDAYCHQSQKIIEALNLGYETGMNGDGQTVRMPVDREKVLNMYVNMTKHSNYLEQYRWSYFHGEPTITGSRRYMEV